MIFPSTITPLFVNKYYNLFQIIFEYIFANTAKTKTKSAKIYKDLLCYNIDARKMLRGPGTNNQKKEEGAS